MARKTATENSESRMSQEEVIRKVQALLARQLHPNANEHEAQVCASKVQELLLAYSLSMSDVDAAAGDGKAPGVTETTVPMGCGPRDTYSWCVDLMSACSHATFCRFICHLGHGREGGRPRSFTVIGQPTDAQVCCDLYGFLSEQVSRLMMQDVYRLPLPSEGGPDQNDEVSIHGFKVLVPFGWKPAKNKRNDLGADCYTYCRNFLVGCGRRVAERLYQQVRETREQHARVDQVTALVSTKDAVIASYITERYPRLQKLAPAKGAAGEGLFAGYQAGERVELHRRDRLENGNGAGEGA